MIIKHAVFIAVVLSQMHLLADEHIKLPTSLITLQGGLNFQNTLKVSDVQGNAQFRSLNSVAPNFSFNYSHLVNSEKKIYLQVGVGYRSIPLHHKINYEIHRGSATWNNNVDFYEERYPGGVAHLSETYYSWKSGDEELFVTQLGLNKLFSLKSSSKVFVNASLGVASHWKFDRNVVFGATWGTGNNQTQESIKLLEVDLEDNRNKLLYHNIFSKFGLLKVGERKVYQVNLVLNMGLGYYAQGEYRVINNGAEGSGKLKMNMNYVGLEFGYGWQL